jgi:son of sevenless-like protein
MKVEPPLLKSGTLLGLVEQLTRHDRLDAQFNGTFLLTYRSFTSAEELFTLLVRRFNVLPPAGLTREQYPDWENRKQKLVRLRVVNILKTWFEHYWIEESSEQSQALLERAYAFTKTSIVSTKTPGAQPLMGVIDQRLKGQDTSAKRLVLTLTNSAPPPILPKNMKKLKFLDIDATEFARQLTIVESKLYGKIKPIECLDKTWQKKPKDENAEAYAPNVKSLILHSNQLTNWVAEMILQQAEVKKRVVVIKHFVGIADVSR